MVVKRELAKDDKPSKRARGLEVKQIPIPLGSKHDPVPHSDVLPQHEFSWGIVAPKGAGKTTQLCNVLNYYKGYFHTIIIFSPTVRNDEKWDWVKQQKLLAENKKLKRFAQKLREEERKVKNKVVGPPKSGGELEGLLTLNLLAGGRNREENGEFDARIPEDNFMHEYDEETLKTLLSSQQAMIDLLKKHGQTKHTANRMLLLFDDLVGSSLFSNARQNAFKMLNTNHRHLSCSIMMISQAFKEIPKTVRTQFSCLTLFEIYSDSEIESIYLEFPMGMTKDQWLKVYRICVGDEYGFMFYNIQRPKHLRVMKNFETNLYFKEEEEPSKKRKAEEVVEEEKPSVKKQ